jgi:(p)ppGpp synthase/HD superfamily hydrolase
VLDRLEYGASENEAIGALLHDVLEDVEPIERARAEVSTFGEEVLRIVEGCTDSDFTPSRLARAQGGILWLGCR